MPRSLRSESLHHQVPGRVLRLLLVEDSQNDALEILAYLAKNGFDPRPLRVESGRDFQKALLEWTWDLIVADYSMPGFSGRQALDLLKKSGLDIPFLFLSGTLSRAEAASAIQAGASDFIPKGHLDRLLPAIKHALVHPRTAKVSDESFSSAPGRGRAITRTDDLRRGRPISALRQTRPSVLLVDDREENLAALESVLSDMGAELLRANSGEEALHLLMKVEPACILLDVRMPGLNGLETARLIKARQKSTSLPILFLTANFDSTEEIERMYEIGASDYIPKPFIPALLRSKVRVFIDLWQRTEDARHQMEQVEALNRELDHFTAAVSHDLRAPLRGIARWSEVLLEDYAPKLDDAGRLVARQIEESARRMDAFISELLQYAHLDREDFHLRTMSTNATSEEVISELAETIQSAGGRVALEGAFPPVLAHPTALKQAIKNLLMNALKFIAPGRTPVVTIRSERRGDQIRLWVEDNGIGIDPADQRKIFEPFVRLNAQDAYPGSGLGLAIVQKAVERMGGRCGCESTPGQGSRFWIDLSPSDTRPS